MTAYTVSSDFLTEAAKTNPRIVRKLTIGTSDYSRKVMSWPKITKKYNDIRPTLLTIGLHNEDGEMNFFIDDPLKLRANVTVDMGFNINNSDELVTLYAGTVERVKYKKGSISISLQDKIKPLTEQIIGSSDVPQEYVDSDYYPADIAWYVVTSFGGLSNVESTSNPDIDYASFDAWRTLFVDDTVLVRARYEGKKLNEALRSIGRYTSSTIVVENDKLTFNRFSGVNSISTNLGNDIISNELLVDDKLIINKQHTYGDYDVNSDYWKIDVVAVDTDSINSYGAREQIEKDQTIWYVDSTSALNFAQRQLVVNATPFNHYSLTIPLTGLARQLGENVTFVDSFFSVNVSSEFRIMGYQVDMNNGLMKMDVDGSQSFTPFILDYDTDSGGLGLLDQGYNHLL